MSITTIQQSTEVTEVGLVTISDIVESTNEEEETIFVREVRCFSEPDDSGTRTLLFTLRMTADTQEEVQMQAPAQTF